MLSFNPFQGLLGRVAAVPVQTSAPALNAVTSPLNSAPLPETGLSFQRPRASFSSSVALAVSLSLFGGLSGCGARTGLLGPEDDAPIADAGTGGRDAGMGGDGGTTHDAGSSTGGMDAGTPRPTHISDLDCDGIDDLLDNCPLSPNPDQMDTDHDGIGDVCDNDSLNPDSDHDGLLDGLELFQLGTDITKADTDGDGISDGVDACPLTPGPSSSQGCQPSPPTCAIEAVAQPMTLCDGTMAQGFRILWNVGNAGTASLKEGTVELTRKHVGQVYVYPPDSRTYEITAASPFGDCANSVTVTP